AFPGGPALRHSIAPGPAHSCDELAHAPGAGSVRYSQAGATAAGRDCEPADAGAVAIDSCARALSRAPARQSVGSGAHGGRVGFLVSPLGVVDRRAAD